MENKVGFFEVSPGNKSMTRILVFILIITGIEWGSAILGVGLYMYVNNKESLPVIVTSITGMLTAITTFAGGWKIIQKTEETKQMEATGANV